MASMRILTPRFILSWRGVKICKESGCYSPLSRSSNMPRVIV